MAVYQDTFLDDTVMEMTTCQLHTFWEHGTRPLSAGNSSDRLCGVIDSPPVP